MKELVWEGADPFMEEHHCTNREVTNHKKSHRGKNGHENRARILKATKVTAGG